MTLLRRARVLALTMCDLNGPADCLSQDILLLKKLSLYGVQGSSHKIVLNYLSNINQAVSLERAVSRCRPVRHDEPRRSVLGPLIFIMHINDLHLHGKTIIFADDITLMNRGVRTEEVLLEGYEALGSAKDWYRVNKLKPNDAKTKFILMSLRRNISEGLL